MLLFQTYDIPLSSGVFVRNNGFMLIELMVVIAIIGFLSMIAIPSFKLFIAKTKRAEAYMNLHSIYAAQKAYWAEHGSYSTQLYGPSGIGWKPEGYKGGGKGETFYYTYGFAQGSEGVSHFTGKLCASASCLSSSRADDQGFLILAAGDIDGDGKPDILSINEYSTISIVEDDLA